MVITTTKLDLVCEYMCMFYMDIVWDCLYIKTAAQWNVCMKCVYKLVLPASLLWTHGTNLELLRKFSCVVSKRAVNLQYHLFTQSEYVKMYSYFFPFLLYIYIYMYSLIALFQMLLCLAC